MPWEEVTVVSQRKEFVMLASANNIPFQALCRRFNISTKTGYKLLDRYRGEGETGLWERSRRPHHSPNRTAPAIEAAVLRLRAKHPAWGGRKLRARLRAQGFDSLPAPSTISDILRRHGLIQPDESAKHQPWQRFEHAAPNDLWQMDFKGHFALAKGRCHPLTVLDDHSRFNLCLSACANEQTATVQWALTEVFGRYGLPSRMTMDNGKPWGDDGNTPYTAFTVWLMRLGIRVSHSRPYHPQTQGKDERFHRTLNLEVLRHNHFADLAEAQSGFDHWRNIYNLERPHEALGQHPPASRYSASPRTFPEQLPPIEYAPDHWVRKVGKNGKISFQGKVIRVSKAFYGYPLGLRPTLEDGVWDVYFCQHKVNQIDLRDSAALK
jgi:transposase InsO family protein